mmetsp:Transcript_46605/g.107635  ORF Transcript_46605/g.107635 Transcript_46605/m.107635 type:complete len:758 (-) Transcript_46605:373-2646(-)
MQLPAESTQRLETLLQWSDMQAPVHVTPHSAHNLETFANTSVSPCDLSMADISQQTLAMSVQLRQAAQDVNGHVGTSGDRSEPRRVGSMLSQPAEVELPSQSLLGTAWKHHPSQPLHLQKAPQSQGLVGWGAGGPHPWSCAWPQQVQSVSTGVAGEFSSEQRVEELNHYIRQQAQEYLEGQAEWSRQIAEVRSECLRELEKVKRDKEEVERQARQELLRLQQRLRDVGIKDEGVSCGDGVQSSAESSVRLISSWATAGVSLEEFQHVQKKSAAAEDRVQELEQYIKDQSAKQLLCTDGLLKEKDEEIQKLRQIVGASSIELQQANAELQSLRMHHQQKVLFWEHGARRLLALAEQFLGQVKSATERGSDGEELENGRFGRTATKLSLTLSEGEGGDVGSLRRLLKDVLKSGKDKGAKRSPQKGKEESKADEPQQQAHAVADEALKTGEESKLENVMQGEGDCPTPWIPALVRGPASVALSDSTPSSRETSPARAGSQIAGQNCAAGQGTAQQEVVSSLILQFASHLRQLIAMSQHALPGSSPCPTPVETSPRSVGSVPPPSSTAFAPLGGGALWPSDEHAHVKQLVESMGPARKDVAQNIIAIEKMLRGLDRDLRKKCEELFGQAELAVRGQEGGETQGVGGVCTLLGEEEEARQRIPLNDDDQLLSMTSLRHAQRQSSAALAEFVQLPQKLKMVFDLTKKLSNEVNGLVPQSPLRQAEEKALMPSAVTGYDVPPPEPLQELERGASHKAARCQFSF